MRWRENRFSGLDAKEADLRKVLLCSDLDRTILPNGFEPESPEARPLLRRLAGRPELTLAYVSGRSESLLKAAIRDYEIPEPDFAIGDVGTTIYEPGRDWRERTDWAGEIGRAWGGRDREAVAGCLTDLAALTLQEPEKQNTYKVSYYTDPEIDGRGLSEKIEARLREAGFRASVIWSVDEAEGRGLIDVLPERATKVHAIRFLMDRLGFDETTTVFAGDSGNDLPALSSGLPAVLVKNARAEVRDEAMERLREQGMPDRLYLARGDFLGMNGNYCAGVLEGLAHFIPAARGWMAGAGE